MVGFPKLIKNEHKLGIECAYIKKLFVFDRNPHSWSPNQPQNRGDPARRLNIDTYIYIYIFIIFTYSSVHVYVYLYV